MLQSFALIFKEPAIRAPTAAVFCMGLAMAALAPYLSVVAIDELGMSNQAFSAMVLATGLCTMVVSLSLGALSDHLRDRKGLIILTTAVGTIGYGLLFAFPSATTLVLVMLLCAPVAGSTFPLLFSAVRAATGHLKPGEAASVNSTVRMFFSAAYMLVPGAVGLYLASRAHMSEAFAITSFGYVLCGLAYVLMAPRADADAAPALASRPKLRDTLALLSSRRVVLAVLSIAILCGPQRMNQALYPLILIKELGGSTADLGLVAGGLALMEVPFLIICSLLLRRFSSGQMLVAGGLIYCLYLTGLGLADARWQFVFLTVINACGSAALISVPMSFFQDLLPDRPGLGTSLTLLQVFVSDLLNAATFAGGTAVTTYSGTSLICAAICAIGCGLIVVMERGRARGDSSAA